jgi:hypothetical protein
MTASAVEPVPVEPIEPKALVRVDRALRVLRPVASPADMIRSQNESRDFIMQVLEKDRDYGIIPGVKKPTLLKPGAEKVTLGFGCSAVPRILEKAAAVSPLDKTWPNWKNFPYAGAKFRDIPTGVLEEQLAKVTRSTEKATADGKPDTVRMGEKLLETIEFVLEDRRMRGAPATATPAVAPASAAAPATDDTDDTDDLPF